jgi:glutamate/tyrosine decarboxylase-like PLP-dependent enzyme
MGTGSGNPHHSRESNDTGPVPAPIFSDSLDVLRRELAAPHFHPDLPSLKQYADEVLAWVLQHHATLPDQEIGRPASRAEMEALFREPAPEAGTDFAAVLAQFDKHVAPHAFRINHPRFLAFIPGTPTFFSMLGDWLCSATNFFAGVWLEAAGPSQVELVVLDWLKELLGYPAEAGGILTSGGSEANLTALVAAREPLSFPDRARAVLYLSEQRHWSMDRAAMVIGLHPAQARPIPCDADLSMSPTALAAAIAEDRNVGRLPWAVCANAGTTNTGAVDPLHELADLCKQQQLWLHVDAAYGWPMMLIEEGRRSLEGIARADSITLDPHKWFGQTFEAGCILVREGGRLSQTFAMRPEYMQDVTPGADEVNFADCGIALTRRFRALKIWLSVKVLGLGWFRRLVERCCHLAELALELLRRSPRIEIMGPRRMSVVCFRYVPAGIRAEEEARQPELNRLNLAVIEGVRATGRAFFSSTRLHRRVAIRFCFVNWRTTTADVEEVVRLVLEVGATSSSASPAPAGS